MSQARCSGGMAEVTLAKGKALLVVGGWTCDSGQSCGCCDLFEHRVGLSPCVTPSRYLASCIMLSPASSSWVDIGSPLPQGGRSNFGMVRTRVFYYVASNVSSRVQALLQPSLLLVWGGSNLQPAYPEASIFNATALTWASAAPLLQARSWSGSASGAGAFAVGGMSLVPFFSPMDSVEMYVPAAFFKHKLAVRK
jgi:hypothetical protein